MRGVRLRQAYVGACAAVGALLLLPHGAEATVSGPCTAELSGVSVTRGHDTPGTAVHVDYREIITYSGEATNGAAVTDVQFGIEIVGLDIGVTDGRTSGSTWTSTADVGEYAWAGVGLYRVRGIAFGDDEPLCQGVVYVCVDGKSPFLTAAGGTAIAFGLISLGLLGRGFRNRRQRGRGQMATTFGLAGLFGGTAAIVLLQQSCVLPLDLVTTAGFVGGGLLGLAIVGAALAGSSLGAAPVAAVLVPQPVPPSGPSEEERDRDIVYRFVPSEDACTACRIHAAHRTYRSREAIEADRAHLGCDCEIVPQPVQPGQSMAQFAGREVLDDRQG